MPKHVLITGGSRGIGRELVLAFSKEGYRVSFTYNRSVDEAKALADVSGALAFHADHSDVTQISSLIREVTSANGDVDVLINNAGVSHYGLFQDVSLLDFQQVFAVDFQSPFFLTKELVSSMISRKSGVIINVASIWGETGASCEVLYSSAKGALIAFTKALAKELAPSGICVNCISPGVVDTDMMARFSAEEKELLKEEIPAGHFTDPKEITQLALFLANHPSTSLTGQIIGLNGGMFC